MSNRRKTNSYFFPRSNFSNTIDLCLVLLLILGISLACSSKNENQATRVPGKFIADTETVTQPKKLESYEVRGLKFAYYLIPKNLSHDELIATAQQIHDREPDTQLILVDDTAQLADYVAYARQISLGNSGANLPKRWAEEHIIGNVQKYLSGKWVLCEGNGYREIGELK